MAFVTFTRRTNDPKLAYLEHRLTEANIPHRRNGHSFHAPIMEVPEEFFDAAEDILLEPHGKKCFDELSDKNPKFRGYQPHDFLGGN